MAGLGAAVIARAAVFSAPVGEHAQQRYVVSF